MRLLSTNLFKSSELNLSKNTIFRLDGKVSSVDIISAYTDPKFLLDLMNTILNEGNQVDIPHMAIFLDLYESRYISNTEVRKTIDEITQNLEKYFDDSSGIYLVNIGKIFHSKCIISKSRSSANMILGSINATYAGFTKNEEIAICGKSIIGSRSQLNRMIDQVYDYI